VASRGTTKRKILDLAELLLLRLGYNGFSYQHLSRELGVKNAAIHYHFPTKEELGVHIIERTRGRFIKWVNNPENRVLPVRQQLDWFVKTYRYNLNAGNRVCLIGSLATDYYTLPPAMQAAINQLSSEIQKWMARLLDSGRQSETLWFEGNSQDKAACVLSSLTGSLQLARLLGNDYFFQAVNQIYVDLKLTY
jgi:AcrR family transcriptional regulator